MKILAMDIPRFKKHTTTNLSSCFKDIYNLYISDVAHWDMKGIIDVSNMFQGCTQFTADLLQWDMSTIQYARSIL